MIDGEIYLDTGVSQKTKDAISTAFETIKLPKDVHTPLCAIMRRTKSDKGRGPWGKHNYTQLYYELLKERSADVTAFLEVGLGTNNTDVPSNMGEGGTPGASVRGWREFFNNAQIYGGDVDKRILFQEERIKTFFIDQTDPEIIKASLAELGVPQFDVFLDDGLHRYQANVNLYEQGRAYLRPGGIYIIEDINCTPENISAFKEYLSKLDRPVVFLRLPHQRDVPDNCLAVIEF